MRSGMLALAAIVVTIAAAFVGLRLWEYKQDKPFWEGISALKAGDYQLALTRLERFAREGDRRAQRALAEMYARGLGVPVDDRRATMWFRRAECQCKVPGEYEYGLALNLASLGNADKVTAVRWLERAAECRESGCSASPRRPSRPESAGSDRRFCAQRLLAPCGTTMRVFA